jgi:23S rRNA-/tRNA-specific pseudouridylate synthase
VIPKAIATVPQRKMNKLEAAYAQHLELMRRVGEIQWYAFECLKIRLADCTFYDIDFLVVNKAGLLEVHETKGFWRDDARVKIKVAAAHFPAKFFAIQKSRIGWEVEEF